MPKNMSLGDCKSATIIATLKIKVCELPGCKLFSCKMFRLQNVQVSKCLGYTFSSLQNQYSSRQSHVIPSSAYCRFSTMSTSENKPVVVDLFYDVLSPYTWFGFEALIRYDKRFSQMKLHLKPASLVDIVTSAGNSAPMKVPAKGLYMAKDLMRLAEYFQIPFNFPKDIRNVMFKKGTHEAMCLLTVVADKNPEYLESLSRELFLRIWSRDEDVTTVESLKQACTDVGLPSNIIDNLIKESRMPETEAVLKKTSKEALGYGAFGLPTYVAHFKDESKMFFGTDRLYMLCYYLNEEYPGPLNNLKPSKL